MKLDANRMFAATALSVAIVWLVCAALVGLAPGGMMSMSGSMMHTDFHDMSWSLSLAGAIAGLFAWSLSAGILAWLIVT